MMTEQLTKAINGEYTAIHWYEKLANLATNPSAKKRILAIREDELQHFEAFSALYHALTGSAPSPKMNKPCPKIFKQGVLLSFQDEQETSEFYRQIADSSHLPYIKKVFNRAAADEQRHAVWFLSFL
ncbi:ferritin-like domain-containing protein [Domibacillus sp. A3M-37]|jgi:rubrerythrin|uniref:ferritin-like domain-containing protein n=1 Tax=Domibacillus TaxID=1433999 RepID=UPI000617EE43|nr:MULTISPECIES: ferritin-like domain-containing protein [Domibacillus]MCP3762263.1 ferritin-like domain-containing protein [Domibacillus sp. A3M-37]